MDPDLNPIVADAGTGDDVPLKDLCSTDDESNEEPEETQQQKKKKQRKPSDKEENDDTDADVDEKERSKESSAVKDQRNKPEINYPSTQFYVEEEKTFKVNRRCFQLVLSNVNQQVRNQGLEISETSPQISEARGICEAFREMHEVKTGVDFIFVVQHHHKGEMKGKKNRVTTK